MINLNLPALFVSPDKRRLNDFYRLEDKINKVMGKIEKVAFNFRGSQRQAGKHSKALNDLQVANPDLTIVDKSVENIAARKRLKRRKGFTVAIEAVLGISAVKLFFSETINVSLTWFVSLLCGLGLAFIILNEAISYKTDDGKLEGNTFEKFWNRFSWFIPLLLIPFLNFYNILMHPGNPTNIIWGFFAILSLWLNLKCASYAKQFAIMKNTAIAEKLAKPEIDGLKEQEKVQTNINRNMIGIKSILMDLATDFKRIYESFGENKPKVNLNPKYILLLNNRFYMYPFLPLPDMVFTNPPPHMRDFMSFFDEMEGTDISSRQATGNTNLPPVQLEDTQQNPDASANEPKSNEQAQANTTQDNNTENRKDDTAPGFDDMINDDEIFV